LAVEATDATVTTKITMGSSLRLQSNATVISVVREHTPQDEDLAKEGKRDEDERRY
jgi:hypothetical protein